MSCEAMKRHGGNVNAYYITVWCNAYYEVKKVKKKSLSEKTTHCMIPTTWHSGKGKTMGMVNISVIVRGYRGERDE